MKKWFVLLLLIIVSCKFNDDFTVKEYLPTNKIVTNVVIHYVTNNIEKTNYLLAPISEINITNYNIVELIRTNTVQEIAKKEVTRIKDFFIYNEYTFWGLFVTLSVFLLQKIPSKLLEILWGYLLNKIESFLLKPFKPIIRLVRYKYLLFKRKIRNKIRFKRK